MVGTAILLPEPGAAPFITVGQTVKAGDTIMIIEAMKVMNPIHCACLAARSPAILRRERRSRSSTTQPLVVIS